MLNKVMLIGNLGADPEIRYMPSGDPIATLNLATTRKWKDKNGERKEETEWHRVTFFGAIAKVCGDYLKKGSKVYIDGRIKTDKYQKDGVDVYRTGIIGDAMSMLDGKRDDNNSYQGASNAQTSGNSAASAPPPSNDFYVDDIPFSSLNWQIRNHLL